MVPTDRVASTDNALGASDLYSRYCDLALELDTLIIQSYERYDAEIRRQIEHKKAEVDNLLDRMITNP